MAYHPQITFWYLNHVISVVLPVQDKSRSGVLQTFHHHQSYHLTNHISVETERISRYKPVITQSIQLSDMIIYNTQYFCAELRAASPVMRI